MKVFFTVLCYTLLLMYNDAHAQKAQNIFIITIDGMRWQEVFRGPDPTLLTNTMYVKDTALLHEIYNSPTPQAARKKLMPFLWSVMAREGRLYGNRDEGNKMDAANRYKISYAGYNEIFTGYPDKRFIPNSKKTNKNTNVLEYLNSIDAYKGKVAAFSSWNVFPYILNEQRCNIPVNSGYENIDDTTQENMLINSVQDSVYNKCNTRHDMLTWLAAKEYISRHHPRVMVLGLGETDKYAHECRYDMYLQQITYIDNIIAELWYLLQTDRFYRNNTTLIITTDHGRGKKTNSWYKHHLFVKGSGEVWMAMMGAGIQPAGEIKQDEQLYLKQIASTVTGLLGEEFKSNHPPGSPIQLPDAEAPVPVSAALAK